VRYGGDVLLDTTKKVYYQRPNAIARRMYDHFLRYKDLKTVAPHLSWLNKMPPGAWFTGSLAVGHGFCDQLQLLL
jgi:hypothetical protein